MILSKTIYFIPGTMCDERLWLPVWQLLNEQYTCDCQLIHLAIPNSGNMAEVVATMTQKIVAADAILVGFSLGGYIASAIALKIPEMIRHLVVISNMPQNLPDTEIKQRKRTITWIAKHGYSGIPNKRIEDLLHPNIKQLKNDVFEASKRTIIAMDKDLGVDVLLHQLTVSMSRPSLLSSLSDLMLSITFLVGDEDALVDILTLEQKVGSTEYIKIAKIENTGHMLPLESPVALAFELNKLLTE